MLLRTVFKLVIFAVLLACGTLWGQGSFQLPEGKKSLRISTKIVNNLIIVPLNVNGTELSFLLDTGVRPTVLFSVEGSEPVKLNNTQTIFLTGAGGGKPTQALKSQYNTISLEGVKAFDQEIYFIPDGGHNFSPRLGIDVNGIIGYSLFKDFVVEVDYRRKYIELHRPETYRYRKCKSCVTVDIDIKAGKPYLDLMVSVPDRNDKIPVTLLVDSGSGDALWLFENTNDSIQVREPYFEDFLGLGLNGDVTGKRSKISEIELNGIVIKEVTAAFPDSSSVRSMFFEEKRNGSLGSEILRRFKIIYDYPGNKMTLRKNKFFDDPFRYNRSGLIIEHSGYETVEEIVTDNPARTGLYKESSSSGSSVYNATLAVQFRLQPNYEIAQVRKGSPAEEAGLKKGDKLLRINGRNVKNLKLEEITQYFFKEDGTVIRLKLDRNGSVFESRLTLRQLL